MTRIVGDTKAPQCILRGSHMLRDEQRRKESADGMEETALEKAGARELGETETGGFKERV